MRDSRKLPRRALVGAAAALAAAVAPARARAATRITVAHTATLGFNGIFIAQDRGFFVKQGLDAELLLIGLNSNIPAALLSNSAQIGGPTPTVLLQAVDGGLDLVVIAGCAGVDPNNPTDGVLVRNGAGIAKPADFVGRSIGVPGLNAYFHVMLRKWLSDNGVDWTRVKFVEVPFIQSADVLRSGSVDAVCTGEPFSNRILAEGIGRVLITGSDVFAPGTPSLFFAATREWATANIGGVHAFRAALADAVQFQADDPAGARVSGGKFMKLPPEVLRNAHLPVLQVEATQAQVQFWIDLMAKQNMIQGKLDAAKLLVK